MFLVGILSWWYGNGWLSRFKIISERLKSSADYFSMGLLLKTLFSPYRQIAAESIDGSLGVRMHAFFDKLLSRVIGSIVRLSVIIIGLIAMIAQVISGIIILIVWLIMPFMPVIGIILCIIGWSPL